MSLRLSRYVLTVIVLLAAASPVRAATVSLAWDANPEADITGYNVYVSTQQGNFTNPIPVGNRTSWTFTGLQNGVQYFFAVQAQSLQGLSALSQVGYVTPPAIPAGAEQTRSDFNSDGRFDLVWRNATSGQLLAWHMSGPTIMNSRSFNPNAVSPDWALRGSGDFNADGKPDLIWHNTTTGGVICWLMDGVMQYSAAWLTPSSVDPSWEIASVRDINLDGSPDILWTYPPTGETSVWYMNGTTRIGQAWINASPLSDPNWKVRGTGDFNGDGRADLLWQNDLTGEPAVWFLNGPTQVSAALLASPGDGNWKIRSVGDTNADGWPDLVFHNAATGGVVIWPMVATTVSWGQWVATVDTNWKISSPR